MAHHLVIAVCMQVTLGNVVRQELASMIPALMADIQSHHNVLDACAAPGSKTEQMLNILIGSAPGNTAPGNTGQHQALVFVSVCIVIVVLIWTLLE